MKKVSILALSILLINFKCICQITKGNWLVGGNGSYSSNKAFSNVGTLTERVIQLSPKGGYFIINKLAAGIKASVYFERFTNLAMNYSAQHTFSFGPFIRYYFLPSEQKVNLFAEGAYMYSSGKITNQKAASANEFSFLGGTVKQG